ncbi:MAG: energy-coupling factor transporter transmembrane protein EcfT [Nitrososphaerales archaeon]|nr:energy-coupling factor transporter transmembrane protein EcfT [Nitrososphaerales archaeon]
MPAWLEYTPGDTVIHRMHPLVKIVLVGTLLLLSGFYWDLRYMAVLGLIGLVLVRLAKIPLSWFKVLTAILIGLAPFTLIGVFGQTNPALFKVYPQSLVSITLGKVSFGPLGTYGITMGGVLWGIASDVRIGIILLFTYTFIYTTSFNEVLGLLGNTRFPKELLFVMMVAYRFVPEMIRQMQVITTALRLRGWELRSRNPRVIVERTVPLIKALLGLTMVTIDEVTLATRIRVFGKEKITVLGYKGSSPAQKTFIVANLAVVGVALYFLAVYGAGLI